MTLRENSSESTENKSKFHSFIVILYMCVALETEPSCSDFTVKILVRKVD